MVWAFIILLAVVVYLFFGWQRRTGTRRKAPNILGDNGFPKPEVREGAVRNEEE